MQGADFRTHTYIQMVSIVAQRKSLHVIDDESSVRAIELDNHPFFIGTLFQPERAALKDQLPVLVKAFVQAILNERRINPLSHSHENENPVES